MQTANTAAAVAARHPRITAAEVHSQTQDLVTATVAWLQSHWLQIVIASAIGAAIVVALFWLRGLGARLAKRSHTGKGWPAVFGRAIERTGSFFIVMLAARLVGGYAQPPVEVSTTIGFLFTVAVVFQAAVWAREIILGAIEHRTRGEHYSGEALVNAMGLIRLFVTFAVFAIALVVVLSNLGVNVSGLVAGLGVGGIAVGLAAQSIFADRFAAIAIIFDRPFKKGDAITYDKSSGTVEYIGMRSTRIRGAAGEARIIGNKKLLDQEIINNSQRDQRRVTFTLGLVQTTPVETMQHLPDLLKQVVERHQFKFVRAGFAAFGDSSYDFELQFDSPSAAFQDMYDARHAVGLGIIACLNDCGIALAYPTQTGLSAAEGGMTVTPPTDADTATPREQPAVAKPPSSGDRSAADQ